ncbi:MAG: hypothetical protein ABSE16_04685 [Verrucomicrobiota bacterium]|jgi:hypothetical protein
MSLPNEPVTLSVAQVRELNETLTLLRHDLNNSLSLMVASMELIRRRPETAPRMWVTLEEQPRKITENFARFSASLEAALGITRP